MSYYVYVIELDKEVGKIKSLGLKILNTYMEIVAFMLDKQQEHLY